MGIRSLFEQKQSLKSDAKTLYNAFAKKVFGSVGKVDVRCNLRLRKSDLAHSEAAAPDNHALR